MNTTTSTTLRGYARHRGVSISAVRAAIRRRRLVDSVQRDATGRPRIVDIQLADSEWAQNTQSQFRPLTVAAGAVQTSAQPPLPAVVSAEPGEAAAYASARARREAALAELAELKLAKQRGELVEAAAVVTGVTNLFTVCRTQLLALPSKAKQVIPELSHEHVRLLDGLVRQALEELSETRVVGCR
jgi:hypothetical protein